MSIKVYICKRSIDPWCNGNTLDFGSSIQGSSPCGSTSLKEYSNTDIKNHREFIKHMILQQFDFQLKNKAMSEMLIWELADKEDFASTIAIKRELMSEGMMNQYKHLLDSYGVSFSGFVAMIISSTYYLLIHKDKSTFCGIDLNLKQDRERFI